MSGNPMSTGLKPEFLEAREALEDTIRDLKKESATLQRLTKKLGTASDGDGLRKSLKDTTAAAKETAAQVSSDLRKLKRAAGGKAGEKALKEAEHMVAEGMAEFRNASQASVSRQRRILEEERRHHVEEEENDDQQHLLQANVYHERRHELDWNEQLAEQRSEEIADIESSVVEIFEIFRELDVMVNVQGEQLATADQNVDRGLSSVEAGREELVSANRSAQKSRRLKLWLLLFVLLAVLILVLWLTNK
ncbi:Syntaxin pep12 [Diplonema papillatum]|nr:Syntaxin pep12 [Diplonema papillatum]